MKTPEILLTAKQLNDLNIAMQAMEGITASGYEWEYVEVFNEKTEDGKGRFLGNLITVVENNEEKIRLRIEYFED